MQTSSTGYQFRDGIETSPSPYLRWAIVEDVYEEDVYYPSEDPFGNENRPIPLSYARSVAIRWLHHGGGRSTAKFLENWGGTSMPMKGAICAVGFIGGPTGEPVILGFWTQGYNQRLLKTGGSGEIGPGLRPGQEVIRRSGWRLRIVPYYNDLREFAEQYSISPWSLDFIAGEQHDVACFCAKCQTRVAAIETRDKETGEVKFTCPVKCPICADGKPALVSGSVAGGQGESWLAVQEIKLVSTVMRELSDLYDAAVVGMGLSDIRLQVEIQKRWKGYRDNTLKIEWGKEVSSYFRTQVVRYWESILTEYFTVGNLLNYTSDVVGQESRLVQLLHQYVEGFLYTNLTNYLMLDNRLTEVQRTALIEQLGENLKTYVLEYTPRLIQQMVKTAIMNKARVYIAELASQLRRKAVNWLTKNFLTDAKDAAISAIKDRLDLDWSGFRWVRDTAADVVADFYEKTASLDLVNAMRKALSEGLQDPEELPIMEIRGEQDVRSVLNPQTNREEGQGQKAAQFRLKLYRDGEMHLQIQQGLFLYFRSDGTVELDCNNIHFTADALKIVLQNTSQIAIKDVLQVGNPGGIGNVNEFKKVTLDEDNVREYSPPGGVVTTSTRDYVKSISWDDAAGKQKRMFDLLAVVAATNPATAIFVPLLEVIAEAYGAAQLIQVTPLSNSIIGKTEASAEHIEGN